MTSRARLGVIGAGWWAVENHLPILKDHPNAELVAVCRLGTQGLEDVQDRFGFAVATEDYRELLDEDLDGVIVSSPHVLHYEHAKAALGRGLHVMVEKPLTADADEARDLVARAEQARKQILIPYGWNFKPYTRAARRMIREGQVGEVKHVVLQMASALQDLFAGEGLKEAEAAMFQPPASTWADPERAGGYGWGQLTHPLGLLFRISDLVPKRVFAMMGASPTGVDYYDAMTVQFENGATASVSGSATAPKHRGFQIDLRVFGTEGMLLLDIERERLELRRHDEDDEVFPIQEGDGAYSCVEPVERFLDICLGRDVDNDAPGLVGMRAVEVMDAAHRSARSGQVEAV